MPQQHVVVVGAGIGGLAAAVRLAARGVAVTVVEAAAGPGGKLREIDVDGHGIDAGATVFTMRGIFEEIFAEAGTSLGAHLSLRPVSVLARHAWDASSRLDLHADIEASAAAIGEFAGAAEARRYRLFAAHARRVYATLEQPFIRAPRPRLAALGRGGVRQFLALWRMRPFATMMRALQDQFADPRLRQLFGRYATYCGSSPFLAPATLMLVAHVEQDGVWLVEGGMRRVPLALAAVAAAAGAVFRYGAPVAEVLVADGRATGVRLASGERIAADAVIVNADVAALRAGRLGTAPARGLDRSRQPARSLSAITWTLVARTRGFPLLRHNVFFSGDYAAEFDDIFGRARPPGAPTVYVCAQDRDDRDADRGDAPERLLCLINAPPTGDRNPFDPVEVAECERRTFRMLERCGLAVHRDPTRMRVTTPADFEKLFPGTGGALYGPASHGWTASFRRQGCRTRIPRMYVAGGSTHPGPGVPMAALSGSQAASAVLADLPSTATSRPAATHGGTSTRSPTTAATR